MFESRPLNILIRRHCLTGRQRRLLPGLSFLVVLLIALPGLEAAPVRQCELTFRSSAAEKSQQFADQLRGLAQSWRFDSKWESRKEYYLPGPPSLWGVGGYSLDSVPEDCSSGVRFELNEANESDRLEVAPRLELKNYPAPEAVGGIFTSETGPVRFSNIGSRQMHLATQAIDELLNERYLPSTEKKQVFLGLPLQWLEYHSKMSMLQSRTSLLTMLNYKQRKPYLVREDLENLNMHDMFRHSKSEYIVVTKENGRAPFQMTLDEYQSSLLAAMRIARAGRGMNIDDIESLESRVPGYLPCLERLTGSPKDLLRNFFAEAEFKGLRVAELTRFSRFQDVSPMVIKALILKAYEFASHPTDPIDVFVMEVDSVTRRLFQQYGLEELVQFPTEANESPEYLMMVDTRTPAFRKVLEKLREETASFRATQSIPSAVTAADVIQISSADYFKEDPLEKYNATKESRLRLGLLSFRNSRVRHRLKSGATRVTSRPQVLRLVKEAIDSERGGVNQPRISESERRSLQKNVFAFSDGFRSVVSGLNQFASTEGEIVFVGSDSELYAEALKSISAARRVHLVSSLNELSKFSPGSVDAVILSREFSKTWKWEQILDLSRTVLKRNRVLLTLDPTPDRGWTTSMPKTTIELHRELKEFAESILKNGGVVSEDELRSSLLMALEFFRECQKSNLKRRQIVVFAKDHGFGDHFNYGFQLSWFMGGELNWMHKE